MECDRRSVLFFLICGIGGSLSCQSRDAHSLTITLKMQTLFLCLFLFGLGSSEIGLVEFQEETREDCEVLVQVCIFAISIAIFFGRFEYPDEDGHLYLSKPSQGSLEQFPRALFNDLFLSTHKSI